MPARTEDTTSASRTETPYRSFSDNTHGSAVGCDVPMVGRGPGCHHTPLLSVTASRKPYALIARSVLADQSLPDGAFALLASLASLHRGNRPLTLSAQELAVSQGVTLSTHYDSPPSADGAGLSGRRRRAQPRVPTERGQRRPASYCKVDLNEPLHRLPPQAVRALAVLSDRCNGDKRSRARVPTLARASGRSVRAWHRAFVALVVAGWAWSRGRWRGLGRQQVRGDSGKRHTPFRRMSDLISSSRERQ